eukprot:Nitzschia sp. Nitz4//scaffold126_size65214//29425//30203//NITZ4_006155-RA/size65214-snap-gene-0.56-mRNA-1//-1//CDS//3329534686//9120//frame0
MACCIGGVCIPYTAIIPLIVIVLKWLVGQLGAMGLMPKSLTDWAGGPGAGASKQKAQAASSSCACSTSSTTSSVEVKALESAEDLEELLDKGGAVLIKFTASWCKPCKRIHPYFAQLGYEFKDKGKGGVVFVTVDVDDVDDLASQYQVAMMPTFVMVRKEGEVARYAGSSEPELKSFIESNL